MAMFEVPDEWCVQTTGLRWTRPTIKPVRRQGISAHDVQLDGRHLEGRYRNAGRQRDGGPTFINLVRTRAVDRGEGSGQSLDWVRRRSGLSAGLGDDGTVAMRGAHESLDAPTYLGIDLV